MFERNLKNYNKTRRVLRPERLDDKKPVNNLKQLHKLLIQDTDQYLHSAQQQNKKSYSNIALTRNLNSYNTKQKQINKSNRSSQLGNLPKNHKKKQKNNPVNFYINIDKLKNLKINTKQQKTAHRIYMSNPAIKSQHYQYQNNQNRKSLMLRNLKNDKNQRKGPMHSSYEQNTQKSLSKIYGQSSISKNFQNKSNNKFRYKTASDQKQQNLRNSSTNSKYSLLYKRPKNNFKKAQQKQYKDRSFIQGYLKGKQLGRGGFSKVWEGFHYNSKTFFAIKQIDTTNKYQTHLTEIWFGNYFFQNGKPKQQFTFHPGIKNLLTMHSYSIIQPRAFIVYQSCQGSLGGMLYDIYQQQDDQQDQDDKLYMIKYKKLYDQLRKSTNFLKSFILNISQALDLLAQNKIIHSDIKTQNILLKFQQNQFKFKLIDYGSSFMFQSLKQYKLATPQYMCPELLNFILYQNKKQHRSYMLQYIRQYQNTSAIDVWGVGCIILELIHGIPLWLTNPTRIQVGNKIQTKRGLFAVSDRSFSKILDRQLYINNSQIMIDNDIKQILKGMLNPNPMNRIRPNEILKILRQQNKISNIK